MLCLPCSLCVMWHNLAIWACIAKLCIWPVYTHIYWLKIIRTCAKTIRQHKTKATMYCYQSIWIVTVRDWTVSFFLSTCTACIITLRKKENSFNKLICMIQILWENILLFSTIHKIFLTLNYFRTTTVYSTQWCTHCSISCSSWLCMCLNDHPSSPSSNSAATSRSFSIGHVILSLRACSQQSFDVTGGMFLCCGGAWWCLANMSATLFSSLVNDVTMASHLCFRLACMGMYTYVCAHVHTHIMYMHAHAC